MRALTEVVPLLLPMVSVTVTGFVVPFKFAPVLSAWNAYRKVPVGVIRACRVTPLMNPAKVNEPPICLKEPGRDGDSEGADSERDRLGDGIDPGRGAAQGEAGLECKGAAKGDLELSAEGDEWHHHRRRHNAHAKGVGPHWGLSLIHI